MLLLSLQVFTANSVTASPVLYNFDQLYSCTAQIRQVQYYYICYRQVFKTDYTSSRQRRLDSIAISTGTTRIFTACRLESI
jgi:hypothetical protein